MSPLAPPATLHQTFRTDARTNAPSRPKQYKTRFKEWGIATKYITPEEYEYLLTLDEQDYYVVRGKQVPRQDVTRFARRRERNTSKSKSKGSSNSKSGGSKNSGSGGDGGSGGGGGGGGGSDVHYHDNAGEGSSTGGYAMAADYSEAGGAVDYTGFEYDQDGNVYSTEPPQGYHQGG